MKVRFLRLTEFTLQLNFKMAKSIVFGTKIILQISSTNIYGWSCNASVGCNVNNI